MTGSNGSQTVVYTRISRDITGEGEGVQRQEEACRKLADSLGLEVAHVYTDNDIGASNRTGNKPRPEYRAMLEAVDAGQVGTIIAYSNSRLTRRPREWMELIGLAESGKLKIKTVVSGSHDLTTADGRAVALTVAAWDAAEADRISERQRLTFAQKAQEGKPKLQRQRPFGWEDDGTTIRESEAALIREAIEEIKAGATIASIRHRWNQAGIKTAVDPDRSKKDEKPTGEWEWSVVNRVLLGWRTAGIRTRHRKPLEDQNGQLVRGQWEPIISLEDRAQALAALKRHARKKLRTGSWPLAGLLRCGECGQPLYGQLPSGPRSRTTYGCKTGHLSISAGLLEQLIIRQSMSRAYEAQTAGRPETPAKPRQATDWPRHEELATTREQIAELLDAYRTRRLAGSIVFSQVDELDQIQKQLQKELDDYLAEDPPLPNKLRQSAEALEWLYEVQGQFERITPRRASKSQNQPWGASDLPTVPKGERPQELPYAASDEETAELNRLLRGELEHIIIRKGKAGRQSRETFEARVDPIWRE